MEDKKNVNPTTELPDEALDAVSGGAGFARYQDGYERPKNDPVEWKYLCRYCGAWRKESELAACNWICPTCTKYIDRETAERSR